MIFTTENKPDKESGKERVVQATRFGDPEVLVPTQAPDPVAGPGQVAIGVSVAPVLTLETQIRRGWGGEYFDVKPPYVPGGGVAGEVISVGEDVDPGWVGRRVVARTDGGGYAEAIEASTDAAGELDGAITRVHPERIISFGIDESDLDPHLLTPNKRNVAEPPEHRGRN